MFHVYLLQSLADGSYYIGQCEDIIGRLKRHNDGFVPSTKGRRPWHLLGSEEYGTRNEARWREYTLKKNSNERKKFYKKFEK